MNNVLTVILTTVVVMVGLAVVSMAILMLVAVWLSSGAKLNTETIREAWQKSALANSYFFDTQEITAKAENDGIYLRISNVEPDVIYMCTPSSLSKYCQVKVDKNGQDGYRMDLSTYFWDLHRVEIDKILAKYRDKLYRWTDVQIKVYNNDTEAATAFMKELLEIKDLRRLYRAYLERVEKGDSLDAWVTFGDFWFDFYDGNDKDSKRLRRYSLFEWALEQGL